MFLLFTHTDAHTFIQKYVHSTIIANNTPAARKFLWNWDRVLYSMMPILGPHLGISDQNEQQIFMKEVLQGLPSCGKFYWMYSSAAQKQ